MTRFLVAEYGDYIVPVKGDELIMIIHLWTYGTGVVKTRLEMLALKEV